MHVRKFEADSLEEALGSIKTELGPDAIILKTITNKGLKGAFKKKKIEITAAISENNYIKKARVDNALGEENKPKFYSNSSEYISGIIDNYDNHHSDSVERGPENKNSSQISGYGNLGINKQVQSAKNIGNKIKSGLDDFLSLGQKDDLVTEVERVPSKKIEIPAATFDKKEVQIDDQAVLQAEFESEIKEYQRSERENNIDTNTLSKMDELEKKVFMLSKTIEHLENKEPVGIYHLRTTLSSLDISSRYIQSLVKKALFELSEEEMMNIDFVFEFALKEMAECIHTEMPLFSYTDSDDTTVTILISESEVGQTKMVHKLGALRTDSILIKNFSADDSPTQKDEFCEKLLNMEVIKTDGISEIVGECRKASSKMQSVFIDYKNNEGEIGDIKKFIDGMRRSFKNVEVLLSLSSINSELYNRKMVSRYRNISNGIVVSNLDLCLNFGSLFNICHEYSDLPLKFFGTGEVVPDDLESATAERILAGLFQL